jgi:hypothetical protein
VEALDMALEDGTTEALLQMAKERKATEENNGN